MKLDFKAELLREITRDSRNRLPEEYLKGLNEGQLQEVLKDLNFQVREDV